MGEVTISRKTLEVLYGNVDVKSVRKQISGKDALDEAQEVLEINKPFTDLVKSE